jgi:hypothetical protein
VSFQSHRFAINPANKLSVASFGPKPRRGKNENQKGQGQNRVKENKLKFIGKIKENTKEIKEGVSWTSSA